MHSMTTSHKSAPSHPNRVGDGTYSFSPYRSQNARSLLPSQPAPR